MSRLITFGSDITWGTGLKDNPKKSPSKYAWPNLVAKKLDKKLYNQAKPNLTIKEIWHIACKFNYKYDDTVIILWPNETNHHVLGRKKLSKYSNTVWKKNFYNKTDAMLELNIRMNHVDTNLRTRGFNSHHCVTNFDDFYQEQWNNTHVMIAEFGQLSQFPKGTDNIHPGEEAHEEFTNRLVEEIKGFEQ